MAGEQADIPRTGPETWGSENHATLEGTACRLLSPIERTRGATMLGANRQIWKESSEDEARRDIS